MTKDELLTLLRPVTLGGKPLFDPCFSLQRVCPGEKTAPQKAQN